MKNTRSLEDMLLNPTEMNRCYFLKLYSKSSRIKKINPTN